MLSRVASVGLVRWLFVGGMTAGLAIGVIASRKPAPPAPEFTCREPLAVSSCAAVDEASRATAVIHFFDNEVDYATAADPAAAKAAALLALPMPCVASLYSYPALSRHVESAAIVHLQRGDRLTAQRLVEIGRAYNVDSRMLDMLEAQIAAR